VLLVDRVAEQVEQYGAFSRYDRRRSGAAIQLPGELVEDFAEGVGISQVRQGTVLRSIQPTVAARRGGGLPARALTLKAQP